MEKESVAAAEITKMTAPSTPENQPMKDEEGEAPTLVPSENKLDSITTTDETAEEEETSTSDDKCDDQEEPSQDTKRKVSFGCIEIREYSRCLGNNPATTHGPPLSLGWAYNIAGTIGVEEYEGARPPRRVTNQMLIPGDAREDILLDQANVTKKQIQAVIREVKETRHKRQLTVAMQEFETWHAAAEFVTRRFRRMRNGVSKQREQELLWENASKMYPPSCSAAAALHKRGSSKTTCISKSNNPAYDSDCDSSTLSDSGYIQVPVASA